MKLQTTLTTIITTLLLTLFISACSSDAQPILKDTQLNATSGERVDLVAFNGESYSWSQVSGRSVILINANTATLSFIAPDVNQTESLVFEVEALLPSITNSTTIRKERVTVTVHPLETETIVPTENNTTVPTEINTTVPTENNITTPTDTNTTVPTDENTTTPIENNTTVPTNPLKSIALSISKNSLNIDENTILNAIATYADKTTKDVTEEVKWISTDLNAIEISKRHLQAKRENNLILQAKLNAITSNAVALEIYQNINGHRLPPEPNKALNDSTLLGIDSNDNGVRDDVERWIYEEYKEKHPIHIDIAMQAGRAYKQVLETPEKALEIRESISAPYFCSAYYQNDAKYLNEPLLISERIDTPVKSKYFNTKERTNIYWEYDTLLSGGGI